MFTAHKAFGITSVYFETNSYHLTYSFWTVNYKYLDSRVVLISASILSMWLKETKGIFEKAIKCVYLKLGSLVSRSRWILFSKLLLVNVVIFGAIIGPTRIPRPRDFNVRYAWFHIQNKEFIRIWTREINVWCLFFKLTI